MYTMYVCNSMLLETKVLYFELEYVHHCVASCCTVDFVNRPAKLQNVWPQWLFDIGSMMSCHLVKGEI